MPTPAAAKAPVFAPSTMIAANPATISGHIHRYANDRDTRRGPAVADTLTAAMNRALTTKMVTAWDASAEDDAQNEPSMLTNMHAAKMPKPSRPMEPNASRPMEPNASRNGSGSAGRDAWSAEAEALTSGQTCQSNTPLISGYIETSAIDAP